MRTSSVALAMCTLLAMGWMGCKRVDHERRDLANDIVAAAPNCRGWAAGHDRQSLILFCDQSADNYVESVVLPAIETSCDELKRLEFEEVTIYGPKGSKTRWGARLDQPNCKVAAR